MAAAARGAPIGDHRPKGPASRLRRRIRIGSGVQSRLRAHIWNATRLAIEESARPAGVTRDPAFTGDLGLFAAGCAGVLGYSYAKRPPSPAGAQSHDAFEAPAAVREPGAAIGPPSGERTQSQPAPASADPVFALATDVSSPDSETRRRDQGTRQRTTKAGHLGSAGSTQLRRPPRRSCARTELAARDGAQSR